MVTQETTKILLQVTVTIGMVFKAKHLENTTKEGRIFTGDDNNFLISNNFFQVLKKPRPILIIFQILSN